MTVMIISRQLFPIVYVSPSSESVMSFSFGYLMSSTFLSFSARKVLDEMESKSPITTCGMRPRDKMCDVPPSHPIRRVFLSIYLPIRERSVRSPLQNIMALFIHVFPWSKNSFGDRNKSEKERAYGGNNNERRKHQVDYLSVVGGLHE